MIFILYNETIQNQILTGYEEIFFGRNILVSAMIFNLYT